MRNIRRPKIPKTLLELVNILNAPENDFSRTLQEPPAIFFQQTLVVDENIVGLIFANINLIDLMKNELWTVQTAGCDGTFKTVPSSPKILRRGSFMTFQIIYKNVVSLFKTK